MGLSHSASVSSDEGLFGDVERTQLSAAFGFLTQLSADEAQKSRFKLSVLGPPILHPKALPWRQLREAFAPNANAEELDWGNFVSGVATFCKRAGRHERLLKWIKLYAPSDSALDQDAVCRLLSDALTASRASQDAQVPDERPECPDACPECPDEHPECPDGCPDDLKAMATEHVSLAPPRVSLAPLGVVLAPLQREPPPAGGRAAPTLASAPAVLSAAARDALLGAPGPLSKGARLEHLALWIANQVPALPLAFEAENTRPSTLFSHMSQPNFHILSLETHISHMSQPRSSHSVSEYSIFVVFLTNPVSFSLNLHLHSSHMYIVEVSCFSFFSHSHQFPPYLTPDSSHVSPRSTFC